MHVFCHRSTPYAFEDGGPGDWMSRHFFSGGMMPSDDLALRFQDRLALVQRWRWDGRHYERTANAWLANLDARARQALRRARAGLRRRARPRCGCSAGGFSSWPAPSCSATAADRNGGCSHYLFERRPR